MATESSLAEAPASGQLIGARQEQEDALATRYVEIDGAAGDGEQILVLADGMGGHVGGATASRLAVETLVETYARSDADIPTALRAGLDEANAGIARAMLDNPDLFDMGTTLIGASITGNRLYWVSVGDSPLWLYRDGRLQRLNADHSMAPILEGLVEIGRMSEEDAANDVRRHHLRSAVSGEELVLVDLAPEPVLLETGDLVVLASDGVETLSAAELEALLSASADEPLERLRDSILQAVTDAGRQDQDNASLILYRCSRQES